MDPFFLNILIITEVNNVPRCTEGLGSAEDGVQSTKGNLTHGES